MTAIRFNLSRSLPPLIIFYFSTVLIYTLPLVLLIIRNLHIAYSFTGHGMKMKIKLGKDSARRDSAVSVCSLLNTNSVVATK